MKQVAEATLSFALLAAHGHRIDPTGLAHLQFDGSTLPRPLGPDVPTAVCSYMRSDSARSVAIKRYLVKNIGTREQLHAFLEELDGMFP